MSSAKPGPRRPAPAALSREAFVRAGRQSLERGAWLEAKRAFEAALRSRETPDALEGLALAAWWLDLAPVVFASRERAYQLYRRQGDAPSAARVAVWLAWDSAAFRGEQAVAHGWLRRARQLVDGLPPSREHAWLAAREGIFALLERGDPDAARTLATEAIHAGQQAGSIDFEMLGHALHGFASVVAGAVLDGMDELDSVSAAVLAGELTDPIAIGLSCCYLVGACERVRDTERAAQWCTRLRQFCTTWGLRPLLAVCRTQYASICVWRGDWREAEQELRTATRELQASRPAMTAEGRARLGELRRRQGRLDDAAALFELSAPHPIAIAGQIALLLDRHDYRRAADRADRHLRHLLPHNRTERAATLELLIRAQVGLAALRAAKTSLGALTRLARGAGTAPLRAAVSVSAGLIAAAEGRHDDARRKLEDAVDIFQQSGAPFELAQARVELARTLFRANQPVDASRELQLAIAVFVEMEAAHDLRAARALESHLATHGRGTSKSPAAAAGLTPRELDVLRLIARGLRNAAIGRRLFISEHTVHRHVANMLSKLDVPSRSAAVARAGTLGLLDAD